MNWNRRQLFRAAAGLAAAGKTTSNSASATPGADPDSPDFAAVRNDFPWLSRQLWLSAADYHPLGIHSLKAMESYARWRSLGPGQGRTRFTSEAQAESRRLFAQLIGAKTSEISFVQSTTDGENIVVAGLELARLEGNVVIDDLHYQASKYLYRTLTQGTGLELRVVPHRDWKIDLQDMERAIDSRTRLVSMALVSNINGYLADARPICERAHRQGAYVYADIIQGAGAIPIDVQALGIDFAACGAYKWLMGDMGFGFLYVREDLQGTVVKRTRYGARQFRSANQADSQFEIVEGAPGFYEMGSFSSSSGICTYEALKYIHRLGIPHIRRHAKSLTDRLQQEMPALGYPSITPAGNPTPIVSFLDPHPEKTQAKLDRAFGEYVIAPRRWEFTAADGRTSVVRGLRISPSVYNNQHDIDRLLAALG